MTKLAGLLSLMLLATSNLWAQLNVYYVDVGQGDATYIDLPNGHNVLIDGGNSGAPIYKFLKDKGVTTIDHVLLTHPHSDHYRGLKKVFAEFDVKNFYDTKAENRDAIGDNNLRELADAEPGCKTHFPEPGDQLNWDSRVTVKVLNSCYEPVITHNNDETNACSLIIRFFYNGTGLLFMGDADSSVENAMTRIFKSGLQSYALKVGHHGSRYSSTEKFLARVQPKVAVISVGANNNYGHPHREAIDRLLAVGAQIFMTTSGTQTLFIPAPQKGVEPVIEGPRPYTPASDLPPAVRDIVYVPPVEAPVSVNSPAGGPPASPALDQLKEAAAQK
ncbi:MAG: hydrolase [Elusimicrobia bacterium CG08_land_8_20_14_0_20_59_10]|nr:MAG: hydrolase [Elusimicrobia bacterium CG08_land_8_20_14_0_20_59_10]